MIDVVVNYRNADAPLAALLIDQALTRRIGARVFRDYRAIPPGGQYPAEIWGAIQQCRILVAVIGDRWLEADEHGRRRIDDPTDFVRREIAEALKRRIRVVPVLVGEAVLPDADDLPADLRGLPLHQYRVIRVRGAEQDVERLADEIADLLDGREAVADGQRAAQPSVTNTFHGTVHAPGSTFGVNVNRGG